MLQNSALLADITIDKQWACYVQKLMIWQRLKVDYICILEKETW